jgi:hypothetical protein
LTWFLGRGCQAVEWILLARVRELGSSGGLLFAIKVGKLLK